MLYVQQSLSPDEEILVAARFHWMYTVRAVFWILFGLALGIAVGYGAIWWMVSSSIRELYPELPEKLFSPAWNDVVRSKGGYLQILWHLHPVLRFSILGLFIMGLFFFTHMMIVKATTEIAVTTDRLIYKKGLIARHVGELSIDRIEGVSVSQEFWGRILGYGRVSIRGMGVGEIILPPIEAPIALRNAIQEARAMKHKAEVPIKTTDDDF
ncbi:MAG: PH domain-containing protein [Proteobacteria bacterium]|nr:PH domain-containing protein [Pseudomonadota bacterium]